MKLTKFGHSCLLVQEGDLRALIDPGAYSTLQNEAKVYTNKGAAKLLPQDGIDYELLENGQNISVKNVSIEAFGEKHAVIYQTIPAVNDTGYMIAERFFHPGDAFHKPPKKVEILALPVAGPWMKLQEAIDYALTLKPKVCFPVHDGMLKFFGPVHALPKELLGRGGVNFVVLEEGKGYEF